MSIRSLHNESGTGPDAHLSNCASGAIRNSAGTVEIVVYYVLFGACWIFFSDALLTRLVRDPDTYGTISIIKGWLFIGTTALLLYLLIKRRIRQMALMQETHTRALDERERHINYANRMYGVLSEVNRSIVRINDQEELFGEICRIMVTVGRFRLSWVGWADKDGRVTPVTSYGSPDSYLSAISISDRDIPEGQGPTGTALRVGEPVVCNDITQNPVMSPWREKAAASGFGSSACFPFRLPDGRMAGLTIYASEPDFFCEAERRLLCEVAEDIGYAIRMHANVTARQVAEHRLREVIDNSPAVIYAFDADGRLLLANAALAALCNRPLAELSGKLREEIGITGDSAERHKANDLEVLRTGTPCMFEETNHQPDGVRTYLTVKFPMTTREGETPAVAGISTDITERIKQDVELRNKNAEMESFTYTVSHDLRSPLVTFKTFLGFLKEDLGKNDPDLIAKDFELMESAARRMERLLDGLLSLSRIGRVVSPPVEIRLSSLLNETLTAMAGEIEASGAVITLPSADITLHGDSIRLQEVWQNLIGNAIKFRVDQTQPRIWIGFEQQGGDTVFYVRDNGIGVDPRFKEKIFGLFEKLDPSREDIGIGLALVKKILQVYGGRVWAESDGNGQGSCFRFTIPDTIRRAAKPVQADTSD